MKEMEELIKNIDAMIESGDPELVTEAKQCIRVLHVNINIALNKK